MIPRHPIFVSILLSIGSHLCSGNEFEEVAKTFIGQNCISCHGSKKQKGDLRLDTLPLDFTDARVTEKWKEVFHAVSGHDMPPEDEPQPSVESSNRFVSLLESRLSQAEIAKRSTQVVLRRMNRAEYNNTIRDLVGVDFNPADRFPEDPPAGGFDNIGQALTMSPMQMELYYDAARTILDRALVDGSKPETIKWRFDPEENDRGGDRLRVKRGENSIYLNKGENKVSDGFTAIHHDEWNTSVGFRGFRVPVPGEYVIRIRAASHTPTRDELVTSAEKLLAARRDANDAKYPDRKEHNAGEYEARLNHFKTNPIYNYGPPRMKLSVNLGGTPNVISETDVDADPSNPVIREFRTWFTDQEAGVHFRNDYTVPWMLENFMFLKKEEFARPELLVDWIELEGPIHATWPPESHSKILFDSPNKDKDENAYARDVLTRFMTRAYRRPLREGELDARVALFRKVRPEKASFVEAIKVPLAVTLASPNFLFLVEPEVPGKETRSLQPFELASRLSYFLWSSMPDVDLFLLAQSGEIMNPDVIRSEVDRLLADPRSDAFVTNFAGQWLDLRDVGSNPPTTTIYPEYDRHLELSIVRETKGFFDEILRNDLDARNLIKSNFVTINERLARFYEIPGVKGDEIRRVAVPEDSHRGGLVTQASMHTITSNGTRTSPVVRGVWIMKTLLGTDPGLPVANVGEIQPEVPGIDKATVRQRLALHRELPSCARCHDKIDPLGLALENFDAASRWREREGHGNNGRSRDNDPPIDASAKMPDGTEFVGVKGLQEQLLKKDDLFLNSLASHLTTYAIGRELGISDRPAIREFVEAMRRENNSIRSLIKAIATSETFTTK